MDQDKSPLAKELMVTEALDYSMWLNPILNSFFPLKWVGIRVVWTISPGCFSKHNKSTFLCLIQNNFFLFKTCVFSSIYIFFSCYRHPLPKVKWGKWKTMNFTKHKHSSNQPKMWDGVAFKSVIWRCLFLKRMFEQWPYRKLVRNCITINTAPFEFNA